MINILKQKLKNRKILVRFILIAAALLSLFCASIYTVFMKPNINQESYVYIEETVEKGDMFLGIMESGSVELEETTLDYTVEINADEDEDEDEGENEDEDEESLKYLEIEEVYVASGQHIETGDKLFKLTEKSVQAVRKKLAATLTELQIAFAEAETEYRTQILQAKSTYDTSVLEAEHARESYSASTVKAQENVNRLSADIKVLQAEIEDYEGQLAEEELWEALEDAQTEYTSAENIFMDTDVHNATAYASNYADYKSSKEQLANIQGQIDDLNNSIEKNRKNIAQKQRQLSEAEKGQEIESLTNKSAYKSAVLGGEQAEEIYNYTVSSFEESVRAAQTEMEEAQSNLEELKSFVGDDGIIYADGSGLVTSVSYAEGNNLMNTGAMLAYVKEDEYEVTIDVSEEDISAVTVGDNVNIVMSAYPEEEYKGTVLSVTTMAASDYAATISYPVTIKIKGNTSLLYGGMTAEVTFVTDSVTDVIHVSKKAIQEENGKTYVYIKGIGGKQKLTEVETGFSDGTDVEIKNGLSEGDTIYIKSRINGSKAELTENSKATAKGEAQEAGGGAEESKNTADIESQSETGNMPEMGGSRNEN